MKRSKARSSIIASLSSPFVGRSCRPANLQSLLVANGLELKDKLYGLIADPRELNIPVNSRTQIEKLTLDNLEDWLSVQANAWQVPPPGIEYLRRKTTESLRKKDEPYLNLIAYHDGRPVASAGLRLSNDYGYLMGAAVNPSARKQGIYRSLLAYRLELIAKHGVPAVIHCLENTSAPICLKLGFEKICEIYSYEPKAEAQ
jgi:ribosomal protein S18 acetylase RimI-like enzyme